MKYYSIFVLLLVGFLTGCGGNVKVTGKVTYSDNGEPVQSGTVMFSSDKAMGRGVITNGKYSAGLIKDGEGLPPGTYTISANSAEKSAFEMAASGASSSFGDSPRLGAPPQDQQHEVYYTKEPQSVDIKKSMTYDFMVERGTRK